MTAASPYKMSLSLNVLNHLGLNLYSNIPAVLSEVVANAYDADAESVRIEIEQSDGRITITDDGAGMDLADINKRFLYVGYQRREDPDVPPTTPRFGRTVMGRKGIGKLSLFSIANQIEVHTTKAGEKHALRMRTDDVRAAIGDEKEGSGTYLPTPLDKSLVDFDRGTRIVLTELKKDLINTASGLRKRLARRFSIFGEEYNFRLFIGDSEVTIADRDYFHLLQYVWAYDSAAEPNQERVDALFARCRNATHAERKYTDLGVDGGKVTGWIGTVEKSGSLKDSENRVDNLNKIVLMVRGKLAHEDLLEEFNEAGVFRSYLIGEIHADFLDRDDLADIATSSRQKIIEDDPRYQRLMVWLQGELKAIGSAWSNLRNRQGTERALEDPFIKEWFESLGRDTKKKAERLFGKINSLTVDEPKQRAQLFGHVVLAFETLRYRDNLDALDSLSAQDLRAVTSIFTDTEDLEAALYYQIVTQRLKVIDKLDEHLTEDALERVLQEHLFENLWLLDPGWERATDRTMEERVGRAFAEIDAKLTDEERSSRIDVRYKRTSGTHVIVELKRASVKTDSYKLLAQVVKYRDALLKYLADLGSNEPVEVVCVVGKDLSDWNELNGREESKRTLDGKQIRVVKYEELLKNAKAGYREYLDREEVVGRIRKILDHLAEVADE